MSISADTQTTQDRPVQSVCLHRSLQLASTAREAAQGSSRARVQVDHCVLKRRLLLSEHFCADKMEQAQKQYGGGGGEAEQTHGDAPSNNSEVGKALDFTFIESALRSNRF